MRRQFPNVLAALILFGLGLIQASPASAHTIPVDSLVQAYMKPQGHVLQVLMRMPLKSYADGDYYHNDNGSVDLTRVDGPLRTAAQVALFENLKVYENGRELPFPHIVAVRMALDSDRSFATYGQALAEMKSPPLAATGDVFWDQAKVDVWFEYPIQSDQSNFAIHAAFDRLAVHETTTLQFISPNGVTRAYDLPGDAGLVSMDPSWVNAATRFVSMGFHHILEGIDHLLFLFALIIPFRRIRPLIPVVTAFTIAHSITLIASAYGYAPDAQWFPPLIELLIAVSILYMALENIVVLKPQHRWVITFFFGLVHGFGFSWVLRDSLQLAGSHVLLSLLSFNVGVELGQLFMLALFVPALNLLFRYVVPYRVGSIILSALVAHQAWHWMEDRWDALSQFSMPSITLDNLMSALPWLIALVSMSAALWLVSLIAKRWGGETTPEVSKHAAE
ncbi:MAG TPA: HupE/UreJ family protein [Rhizomicrobium sp.]|jgi:hypothetical protein|nr:HupE/UreJ family protein [Rhizomicrobium sp.]